MQSYNLIASHDLSALIALRTLTRFDFSNTYLVSLLIYDFILSHFNVKMHNQSVMHYILQSMCESIALYINQPVLKTQSSINYYNTRYIHSINFSIHLSRFSFRLTVNSFSYVIIVPMLLVQLSDLFKN